LVREVARGVLKRVATGKGVVVEILKSDNI